MCRRIYSQHAAIYTASVGNMKVSSLYQGDEQGAISVLHSAPSLQTFALVLVELVLVSLSIQWHRASSPSLGSLSRPSDFASQLLWWKHYLPPVDFAPGVRT